MDNEFLSMLRQIFDELKQFGIHFRIKQSTFWVFSAKRTIRVFVQYCNERSEGNLVITDVNGQYLRAYQKHVSVDCILKDLKQILEI